MTGRIAAASYERWLARVDAMTVEQLRDERQRLLDMLPDAVGHVEIHRMLDHLEPMIEEFA